MNTWTVDRSGTRPTLRLAGSPHGHPQRFAIEIAGSVAHAGDMVRRLPPGVFGIDWQMLP